MRGGGAGGGIGMKLVASAMSAPCLGRDLADPGAARRQQALAAVERKTMQEQRPALAG
jgi:hypothetical protein